MSRKNEQSERRSSLRDAVKKDEEKASKRKKAGWMPFRFFQGKDEETEVIILDEGLDVEGVSFFREEHNLKIGGKWGNFEPCIADSGPCPFCNMDSYPYLVVFLTVLVMKPFTSKKTGKTYEYSKMLLPVKRTQLPEFEKVEKVALKKHGTLRGVSILLFRKDEENSFSTGMPTANDEGNLINDFYSEEDLEDEFGHDEELARDKKTVIKKANEDITIYDYRKLFPEPDADAIREEYDIEVPGSRRANRHRSDSDDTDELPMGKEDSERRSSRRRRRSTTDETEKEETNTSRSRRSRTRTRGSEDEGKTTKATRTRSRRRNAESGEDAEDEPNFDK